MPLDSGAATLAPVNARGITAALRVVSLNVGDVRLTKEALDAAVQVVAVDQVGVDRQVVGVEGAQRYLPHAHRIGDFVDTVVCGIGTFTHKDGVARTGLLHAVLGTLRLEQGRPQEALAAFEQEGIEALRLSGVALAQHRLGRHAESDATLQQLIDRCADVGVLQIAEAFAYLGDADRAFEWLERAHQQRDSGFAADAVLATAAQSAW